MTLEQAKVGQTFTVLRVRGEGALRRRLLDMGILPGTAVTVTGAAPLGAFPSSNRKNQEFHPKVPIHSRHSP